MRPAALLCLALVLIGCRAANEATNSTGNSQTLTNDMPELRSAMKKVEPFFSPMGKPERYDWLGSHYEHGQTFDQFLESNPSRPVGKIYFLPLGTFTPKQQKALAIVAGYLAAFYNLPVAKLPPRALDRPTNAADVRHTAGSRTEQIRTGYIMDTIIKPVLPRDAAALIAFTPVDLFPDSSMSFVFGQASAEDHVGIWSLYRLSQRTDEAKFLRRVLKIAAHETGHMFGFAHCTKYECVMSGTNYLGETDRRPIDACPECMAKVCWLTGIAPAERYRKLADFCRKNGLSDEARAFEQKAAAIS